MKVNFKDCEFGCFEPHWDLELDGKKFKVIDVNLITDDGAEETHSIAEYALMEYMNKRSVDGELTKDDQFLDDTISYYADNNDGVFYILETITGEEIK